MISSQQNYNRWRINSQDLFEMNPVKARDIIMNCFFEAQKETYVRGGKLTGQSFSEKSVRNAIYYSFKSGFRSINSDFDKPTKESIYKLIELLMRKAKAMSTPDDIINYHRKQIDQVLIALEF